MKREKVDTEASRRKGIQTPHLVREALRRRAYAHRHHPAVEDEGAEVREITPVLDNGVNAHDHGHGHAEHQARESP